MKKDLQIIEASLHKNLHLYEQEFSSIHTTYSDEKHEIHEIEKELKDYYDIYQHLKHGDELTLSGDKKLAELTDHEKKEITVLVKECKQCIDILRTELKIDMKVNSTLIELISHNKKTLDVISAYYNQTKFRDLFATLQHIFDNLKYIRKNDLRLIDEKRDLEFAKEKRARYLRKLLAKKERITKRLIKDENRSVHEDKEVKHQLEEISDLAA